MKAAQSVALCCRPLVRCALPAVLLAGAAGALACSSHTIEAVGACVETKCDGVQSGQGGGGSNSGGSSSGGSNGTGGSSGGSSGSELVRPIHRYSFDANDSGQVTDSIGARNGTLIRGEFGRNEAAGTVVLAGENSDQYVDLPNHMLSGLRDATFESWATWLGGDPWQRIFDFGEDDTGVDDSRSGTPRSYFFLAVKPQPRVAFLKPPVHSAETVADGTMPMPVGVLTHLAVVVDERNQRLAIFVNGREEGSNRFTGSLTDVYDVNAWLGRSLFRADADYGGSFSEFRIYDRALTAAQVLASYAAGPDASL